MFRYGPQRLMFEQAYGDQGVKCDGLHMLLLVGGTIRRYGLVNIRVGLEIFLLAA